MSKLNADHNVVGRLGALAVIAAAAVGLHRVGRAGEMCPVTRTEACCAFVSHAKAATSKPAAVAAAPSPAK